jgi:hypothetical protein
LVSRRSCRISRCRATGWWQHSRLQHRRELGQSRPSRSSWWRNCGVVASPFNRHVSCQRADHDRGLRAVRLPDHGLPRHLSRFLT